MADVAKILGQLVPSATTLTDLYAVPASTNTIVSSVIVCNRGVTASTFRISVAASGAADATSQYLYYDFSVPANDSFVATIGITLAAADVLRIYASSTNLSFVAFGIEALQTDPIDGWINPAETWNYTSASTFTVNGNKSTKYSKGDKIKLTQTTVKYFYVTNTALAGIVDTSLTPKALTITGSAAVSAAQAKYGTGSIHITNQGTDRVAVTSPGSSFQFAGDFCMEGWFYPTSIAGEGSFIIINNTANTAFLLINITAANKFNVYINAGSVTFSNVGSWTANQWQHLALARSGTTVTFYVNGVVISSTTAAGTLGYSSPNVAGMAGGGGAAGDWYGDDIRISSVARYTGAFTPPTAQFTPDASTILLLQGEDVTTVTVNAGSDYTLANAAIASNYYSKVLTPNGFPTWFNWSPTVTGFTSPPVGCAYKFAVFGNTCKLAIFQNNATSNAGTLTISLPITASTTGTLIWGSVSLVVDNGGRLTSPGYVLVNQGSTVLTCFKDVTLAAFTSSGTKAINVANVDYEF